MTTWYTCCDCFFVTSMSERANEHEDKTGHLVMVGRR